LHKIDQFKEVLDTFKIPTLIRRVDSTPKCNPSAHAASCNVSAKNTV